MPSNAFIAVSASCECFSNFSSSPLDTTLFLISLVASSTTSSFSGSVGDTDDDVGATTAADAMISVLISTSSYNVQAQVVPGYPRTPMSAIPAQRKPDERRKSKTRAKVTACSLFNETERRGKIRRRQAEQATPQASQEKGKEKCQSSHHRIPTSSQTTAGPKKQPTTLPDKSVTPAINAPAAATPPVPASLQQSPLLLRRTYSNLLHSHASTRAPFPPLAHSSIYLTYLSTPVLIANPSLHTHTHT